MNDETGETDNKKVGDYFGIEITKYPSNRTLIKGSIHKFFNRTDFNGNDFDVQNISTVLNDLEKELGLKPECCKLENIEIGVNIQLPFDPNKILQNLLFHRSVEFNKTISGSFYYQSAKTEYIIKIYNKSAQYEKKLKRLGKGPNIENEKEQGQLQCLKTTIEKQLQANTLRFEIKFLKMSTLNDLGIVYLSDIIKPKMLISFKDLLLKEFKEIYFYDYTTDETKMRRSEINKLKDYRNPNYWINLNKKDKYYHKKQFHEITLKYSQNLKVKVLELINQKIESLTEKKIRHFYR
ncbi:MULTISPECIES: hypothetical protein [Chryseobacterium]|uniref:hypothetical protein n=1 Tax=Chryseobacterium TaxID=59732 RepID=UPI000F4D5549|nr:MULTISPECIES: hypothetical protein [Chryseobacterium]